ncbi:19421_t:CDS:1, partial [Funneliformis geosporum]
SHVTFDIWPLVAAKCQLDFGRRSWPIILANQPNWPWPNAITALM